MKIKDNFMLRKVADTYVVVPVGDAVASFNGMINLNEVGAYLWQLLENEITEEEIITAFLSQYEIDEATARKDIAAFIEELKGSDLLA